MQPLSKEEVDRILDNNLEEEFGKLAATPGFVLKPMPFHQVQKLASEGTLQSLGQLGRHPQLIRTYRSFRAKACITCTVCIKSWVPEKVFAKVHDVQILQEWSSVQDYIQWKDFPYYVEEGISHDNIWSTTPLRTEQLVEVIERQLGPTRKYTYFINPGPLASIPGVWHAHCMHTAA